MINFKLCSNFIFRFDFTNVTTCEIYTFKLTHLVLHIYLSFFDLHKLRNNGEITRKTKMLFENLQKSQMNKLLVRHAF